MKNFTKFTLIALLCSALLIIFVKEAFSQVLYGYEVYVTDSKPDNGKIYELIKWPPSKPEPFPKPVYTSRAGRISSIAIGPDGLMYYSDANKFDIYRTDGLATSQVYHHTSYIRDLAFNPQGTLFFSEASGSGGNGTIYQLDIQHRQAVVYRHIPLNEIDGSWSGNFAFDPSGNLWVSSGNRKNASLFMANGSQFFKKFNSQDAITGFDFINNITIVFTDHQKTLYKLDNFSVKTAIFTKDSFTFLNDVVLARKPVGSNTISGNLFGGQRYWNLTFVSARGPNLMWREVVEPVRVNSDGSYTLRNLAPGKYKVYTDLRADAGTGFSPAQRVVDCTGTAAGVNFQWPAGK